MSVTTVLGDIPSEALGPTLSHEHLFLDLRNQFREPSDPERRRRSEESVQMHNLGALSRNPYAVRDNLVLDDVRTCIDELERFKAVGGRSIVDCTPRGLGRNPEGLRELATRTGLNIVAGCGYYTQDTHPKGFSSRPVESIAEEVISELTDGIDGTSIRAGVIGEIGTGRLFHPDEKKALLAAALAFRSVPAAIQVHTSPWGRAGREAVDLLLDNGVDPAKIVIDHLDVAPDLGYVIDLLARGVFVELDDFGKEYPIDPGEGAFAESGFITDAERIQLLKELLDRGFADQVLITNDICFKTMWAAYGGLGYGHILEHIVPMLAFEGVPESVLQQITVANPARLLDVA